MADPRDDAEAAAREWLALLDSGEYQACWEGGSALMRGAVSPGQLAKSLRSALEPMGAPQSRSLDGADYHETLPGAAGRPLLGHAVLRVLRAQTGGDGDRHGVVGRRRLAGERVLHPLGAA